MPLSTKVIRVPVKLVDGQWELLHGGPVKVRERSIGELNLDKAYFDDADFLKALTERRCVPILRAGVQLQVALSVKPGLPQHLRACSVALGDDVTEVVSSRSIVLQEPAWFVELLPRANGIDMRLACEATELATVAAGVQVTAQWAWIASSAVPGTEGSLYYVNSDAKLEAACALIRKAYELTSEQA